ncbi:hypothetical protein GCK72_006909 [Caenorhabditis remanei]|uniref:Peptidase M13 C-terminal domain-containing protein n=1 Tax=Caenorhabditis remanei TaxID=31234 RepID=A0A6A5HIK1_CAERE|nr:hypothetical protein GCK72_006909 [Caenorhabditis remanei]KAF1766951.1 hypothetical protein GCK72_006909 [Caenorhabditis remanei]
MSVKDKLTNPLTGLGIVISFSLIFIFTIAILTEMKKKNEATPTPQPVKSPSPDTGTPSDGTPSTKEILETSTVIPSRSSSQSPETTTTEKKKRKMCDSPECITLSYQLLNWRDINVDPCEDFYKASCGRYSKHTDTKGTRIVEKEAITIQLISDFLLQNKSSESRSENTMKLYYHKCRSLKDKTIFDQEKNKSLRDLTEDLKSIGSWPSLDKNWDESKFDLNEMLANMAKLHVRNFGIFQFKKDDSKHLNLMAPDGVKFYKGFIKTLEEILTANGIDPKSKEVADDSNEVEKFIKQLDNPLKTEKFNEYNTKLLKSHTPSVDFERIIKNLIPKGKEMEENLVKKMRVEDSEWFFGKNQNLEKLLESTPKRTLANFLIFNFIAETTRTVPFSLVEMKKESCGKTVIHAFPRAAVRIFVRNYFEKENLKIISEMVDEIRDSSVKILKNSTWLQSKSEAVKNLEDMKKMIGYPEDYEAPGTLDRIFESLTVSPDDSYYKLTQKMLRFQTEQTVEYIADDLSLDPEHPLFETNAFYTKSQNVLSIMVSIIDDPLFDDSFPKYAKIVSTGSIIAQEIGHNVEYSIQNPEDLVEYQKRGKCLVDQYSQYDDPDSGKNPNAGLAMSQLIIDDFGADATWQTFKNLDISEEAIIPGFKEDDVDKLFFHIYALNFCSPQNFDPDSKTTPTNSFRVNGVFSNMPSFAKTFECPVGSPMNPKTRCELF